MSTDDQVLRKIVEFSLDYDVNNPTSNRNLGSTQEMHNN
jgi:hypothetical protein